MKIGTTTTIELTDEERKILRDAQQIIANISEAMEDHDIVDALLVTDGIGWKYLEVCGADSLLDNLAESYAIKLD